MQTTTRNPLHMKSFFITSVCTITVLYLLRYHHIVHQLQHGSALHGKEAFIKTALVSTIGDPFDPTPIRELCNRIAWTDGLIFKCDPLQGGYGNVDNRLMDCIRFAMEAGASIITPEIMIRSPRDLSQIVTHDTTDLDYLFDRANFRTLLSESCPQMKQYDSLNDLWDVPSAGTPIRLRPQDLAGDLAHARVLANASAWRPAFDTWLKERTPRGVSPRAPIIIQSYAVMFTFPLSHDSHAFNTNFGHLFRLRHDVRRLAASVLYELSSLLSPPLLATDPIAPPGAYLGAHLRTASDAVAAGWPGYAEQSAHYLAHAAAHSLQTIYVSSGSASSMARFRSDAVAQNCTVLTKLDLLRGADLEALELLTWDQQALVDFEVLLRSSQFVGIERSSFAWKIAVRRHLWSKGVPLWMEEVPEGGNVMQDELSVLFGQQNSFWPYVVWP